MAMTKPYRVVFDKNQIALVAQLIRTRGASLPAEDDMDHITKQAYRDIASMVASLADPAVADEVMKPKGLSV